jgi:hypothetical protein
MMNLETLLKEKSYAYLTETERAFVLQNMTVEDYEAEHQILVLSEKLKQNQAHLAPNHALKAQLLAKMQAPAKPNLPWQTTFRIAASLLFCIGLFFFLQKNKVENSLSETITESKVIPSVIPPITQLPTPIIESQPIKYLKKKSPKRSAKQMPVVPKEDDEDALAQSFNRKNPNLAWQTEEDEVVISEKPTLQCTPN